MDHIAYLSQEIGPRPAGTEEEQQAALYITDRLQKDAHLSTVIEDFTCNANPLMSKIICYSVAVVACLLAVFLPIAAIPAIIAAALAAVVFALESFDHPALSQLFMKGVSQNVVAKYEPTYSSEGAGARRRKVIVVANYDSGKVRRDLAAPLLPLHRPLQYAVLGSMIAMPIVLLLRTLFFQEGVMGIVSMVIALALAVIIAVPLAFAIIEKFAAFNEAANSNASGVAVMLEVARRLGNGEVSASPLNQEGMVHGEAAARAAGVVPEGATLSYETSDGEQVDGLTAAKAAIAVMTGEAQRGDRAYDIAANLVQVKSKPIIPPTSADVSRARQDAKEALSGIPAETIAAAVAKAEQSEVSAEDAMHDNTPIEGVEMAAENAAEEAEAAPAPAVKKTVPDWYKKATQKARAKEANAADNAEDQSYRSRFADFPSSSDEEVEEPSSAAASLEIDGSDEVNVPVFASAAVPSAGEGDLAAADAPAPSPVFDEAMSQPEQVQGATAAMAPAAAPQAAAPGVTVESAAASDAAPIAVQYENAEEEPAPTVPSFAANAAKAQAAAVQAESLVPDATTAMPAVVSGGNLDLDALRAMAQTNVAAQADQGAVADQQSASVQEEPALDPAAASAATTRLPQMMYYTPPAQRAEVMQDRAQKNRVVVSAGADDELSAAYSVDAAEDARAQAAVNSALSQAPVHEADLHQGGAYWEGDAAQAAVPTAQPEAPAPAGRTISANIPMVDLPAITLPPITPPEPKPVLFDDLRQRAPLAHVADAQGKTAAKNLLATTLPSISSDVAGATVAMTPLDNAPAEDAQHSNVSLTGSFAAVSALGVQPVGDELLQDIDPEDIYVEDADDTVFEEEFTETGAFAGPGYVDMPQSRVGKFFGRFRRKKEEEASAHEWLGVDEDFDARKVGKERGGWESFREEDDWQGGAFNSLKARIANRGGKDDVPVDEREGVASSGNYEDAGMSDASAASVENSFAGPSETDAARQSGHKSPFDGVPLSGNPAEANFEEVQQIYSFAAGDINTEVWFVALGSDLADNGGIKAFLADHASEMRGAVMVNLDSLGAGELSYLEHEGRLKQMTASARMKRFMKKAVQASGINLQPATVNWRESPASYALKHRMQAMTLAGMEGAKPALFGEVDDVLENVDPEQLDRAADVVVELLKNI